MPDYEQIAESVVLEGEAVAAEDAAVVQRRANHEYLPVTHQKYQGLAGQKGYKQGDDFAFHRLQKVRYNHESMIDEILANPSITLKELAEKFDVSYHWICTVHGSDAFQAALAKRRDDVTNPELMATIEERFRGLAVQSIDIIARKLEATENTYLALKSLDISAKAMGFGARGPGGGQTNQFIIQLPPKSPSAQDWSEQHNPEMKQLPSDGTNG